MMRGGHVPVSATGAGARIDRGRILPSLLLGMIPPVAIKLILGRGPGRGGRGPRVRRVDRWQPRGTFLTGFVPIAYVGTRAIVLAVGLTLVALGTVAGALSRGRTQSQTASV